MTQWLLRGGKTDLPVVISQAGSPPPAASCPGGYQSRDGTLAFGTLA